jgi:hypothetical protein
MARDLCIEGRNAKELATDDIAGARAYQRVE